MFAANAFILSQEPHFNFSLMAKRCKKKEEVLAVLPSRTNELKNHKIVLKTPEDNAL